MKNTYDLQLIDKEKFGKAKVWTIGANKLKRWDKLIIKTEEDNLKLLSNHYCFCMYFIDCHYNVVIILYIKFKWGIFM